MCVCVGLSEPVECMCAQWTLFDLGFDSPNIAKGMQWIHVNVSVCVNACVSVCVCGSVQGYPLAKANEIWHPAPHPVHSSSTHTHAHKHKHQHGCTDTHLTTRTCNKHFNAQTMQHEGLCVFSELLDPRGCLLGSLGPALRDVINQFRERWGREAGGEP